MRQIINVISGFIFGLSPILGAGIFGLLIYNSLPNTIGIIIIGSMAVGAIWLGLSIFKKVQIVGPIEFMTAVKASPDLDNLEPTKDSKTKRRQPNELVELIRNNNNLFNGGSFRIFGDWFGKPYDNFHNIKDAEFDVENRTLKLEFDEQVKLEIVNPQHIFEASTFLKIINADKITLKWYYNGNEKTADNLYNIIYKRTDKKIETDTNVDWYKPQFDVSLGAPALMIHG